MTKGPFKLRSGNTTPFKEMGSMKIEKVGKVGMEKLDTPKLSDKPVEIIVDQPKPEKTQAEKITAFDERLRAEEAELERVARETRADIEAIRKSNENYNFEDEVKYDIETEVKDKVEPTPEFNEERMDIYRALRNDNRLKLQNQLQCSWYHSFLKTMFYLIK